MLLSDLKSSISEIPSIKILLLSRVVDSRILLYLLS